MKNMFKIRWVLLSIWVIATILFAFNQPDINKVIDVKGQATISEGSQSIVATKMLNKMGTAKGDAAIIVFNHSNKISEQGMKDINKGIEQLRSHRTELKINSIMDPISNPLAKDQMVSKDGTTLIAQITYEKGIRSGQTVIDEFNDALKDVKVNHYITGELAIGNDYLSASNKGVTKSAVITIVFILLVLIIMFRSLVTPLVSLFAVGISYVCSMGIIGILINKTSFPVTSLTEMFIMLVLFGIGTDYNILLFNRYKEELGHGLSVEDAIIKTYKTAGKTVIFSGLIVFMAFASLSFVQFAIYRSANAVSIGIAVLLLELTTLTPMIMKLLGRKLFWPAHNVAGHKESKVWEKVTSTSANHPFISLLIVATILSPIIFFNSTKLSFDTLKDLKADTPSVMGLNLIADKFGRGQAMPATIVIQNKQPMDNNQDLAIIDELTEKLNKLKGIQKVSSVSQPEGTPIDNFYTNTQTKNVVDGLSSANDGMEKINNGLKIINKNLATPDFSSVKDLASGTGTIQNGIGAVSDGLTKINAGIDQGASGADKLTDGISKLKSGVAAINGGLQTISSNLEKIQEGYVSLGNGYKALPGSVTKLNQLVNAMNGEISLIGAKYPDDKDVADLKQLAIQLSGGLNALSAGITTANVNYDTLTASIGKLNSGLKIMIANTGSRSQLVMGINQLELGEASLAKGLRQGSAGQKTIITSMAQLESGAGKIKDGQNTLYTGLSNLSGGMTQLKDGIGKSSDGLSKINSGINETNGFLTELTNTKSFYIPKEALATDDIKQMFDAYMSKDRKITRLTVNLNSDPYAPESIRLIDEINNLVNNQLKGTKLSNANVGIAGPTATTNDLNNVAKHDIIFTQIIVLACIFILLIIVLRSFWIPIYIVGSLLTAYYAAASVTSFLTLKLFGINGIAWNVPFFSFIIIAALGVDYSIFLMRRFKEYPDASPKEAIVLAAKNMGGVVMSAAIILAGTFATLYPSNLHILMELSICIVTGLFLLSTVLLPIVIPALISIQDKISTKITKAKASK